MFRAAPGIIVLETRPRWEAALKRRIHDARIRILGCRKSRDALGLLEEMRGSVLVLDLETGAAEALRLTDTAFHRGLAAGILVIATAAEAELEWSFRELGTRDFLFDSLRGDDLARLCLKQLASPLDALHRTGIPSTIHRV